MPTPVISPATLSLLDTIGDTPLITLDYPPTSTLTGRIRAKAEYLNPGGSLKDRPVRQMLVEALAAGQLEGKTILDSSSGNAGIAYAMIGAALGIPVEIVVPGNASQERKRRIRAHGATLTQTDALEGYDAALHHAHALAKNTQKYFHPNQYKNAHNWKSHYDTTAAEILAQTAGNLTHFVAGVGTGGAITGIGRRLKEHNPKIQIVRVRPELFPGIEGLKSIETPQDVIPEIYDASVVDFALDVTTEEAMDTCHALARQGLFVGQSSGAYVCVAEKVAAQDAHAQVVTLLCDLGERYFSAGLWPDA